MNVILLAIPIFVLTMVIEVIVSLLKKQYVYRVNDSISSLQLGILSQTVGLLAKILGVYIYSLALNKYGAFSFDSSQPWVWILAFFMYDFCYYWGHRAGHEVNLFWSAHIVHHSSEEYNLSTALRQTSTGVFFAWIFYLPMAIIGIPVNVFIIIGLASLLYQYWVHTRLIGKLGWLDYVFVTPSNHRVHHGQNDYCIDKNYGATLIIWDHLFGSFAAERDDEEIKYGIRDPLNSWNPVWGNLHNYAKIIKQMRHTKGLRNKLFYVFAPPGWEPGQTFKLDHFEPATFKAYNPKNSILESLYGILNLSAAIGLLCLFLFQGEQLEIVYRYEFAAVILLHLISTSAFLIRLPYTRLIELIRSLLTYGSLASGIWFFNVSPWMSIIAGIYLFIAIVLLALIQFDVIKPQHKPSQVEAA